MAISEEDFKFVADLVYKEAGIVLDSKKKYLVEARLTQLAREEKAAGYTEVVEKTRGVLKRYWKPKVIDAMTTNETFFFRDTHFYSSLKSSVIPELIKRRANEKSLTMWCAACSTGQEPYSINMMLKESFPDLAKWRVRFVASDLSESVLETARAGRYNQIEMNRGLTTALRERYFTQEENKWIAKPTIKQGLEFRQINLKDPFTTVPRADIIFVRNVLIYFDIETKRAILEKMARVLRPDGMLFLASSESTTGVWDGFERVRCGTGYVHVLKNASNV